ncbi:hypothetical protein D3C75_936070 [compost metagenome]
MPRNMEPRIMPISASVAAAFFSAGALKLGMALDTASTPVSAEQPELNAFSSRNRDMPETSRPNSAGAACTSPVATRKRPTMIIRKMPATNR